MVEKDKPHGINAKSSDDPHSIQEVSEQKADCVVVGNARMCLQVLKGISESQVQNIGVARDAETTTYDFMAQLNCFGLGTSDAQMTWDMETPELASEIRRLRCPYSEPPKTASKGTDTLSTFASMDDPYSQSRRDYGEISRTLAFVGVPALSSRTGASRLWLNDQVEFEDKDVASCTNKRDACHQRVSVAFVQSIGAAANDRDGLLLVCPAVAYDVVEGDGGIRHKVARSHGVHEANCPSLATTIANLSRSLDCGNVDVRACLGLAPSLDDCIVVPRATFTTIVPSSNAQSTPSSSGEAPSKSPSCGEAGTSKPPSCGEGRVLKRGANTVETLGVPQGLQFSRPFFVGVLDKSGQLEFAGVVQMPDIFDPVGLSCDPSRSEIASQTEHDNGKVCATCRLAPSNGRLFSSEPEDQRICEACLSRMPPSEMTRIKQRIDEVSACCAHQITSRECVWCRKSDRVVLDQLVSKMLQVMECRRCDRYFTRYVDRWRSLPPRLQLLVRDWNDHCGRTRPPKNYKILSKIHEGLDAPLCEMESKASLPTAEMSYVAHEPTHPECFVLAILNLRLLAKVKLAVRFICDTMETGHHRIASNVRKYFCFPTLAEIVRKQFELLGAQLEFCFCPIFDMNDDIGITQSSGPPKHRIAYVKVNKEEPNGLHKEGGSNLEGRFVDLQKGKSAFVYLCPYAYMEYIPIDFGKANKHQLSGVSLMCHEGRHLAGHDRDIGYGRFFCEGAVKLAAQRGISFEAGIVYEQTRPDATFPDAPAGCHYRDMKTYELEFLEASRANVPMLDTASAPLVVGATPVGKRQRVGDDSRIGAGVDLRVQVLVTATGIIHDECVVGGKHLEISDVFRSHQVEHMIRNAPQGINARKLSDFVPFSLGNADTYAFFAEDIAKDLCDQNSRNFLDGADAFVLRQARKGNINARECTQVLCQHLKACINASWSVIWKIRQAGLDAPEAPSTAGETDAQKASKQGSAKALELYRELLRGFTAVAGTDPYTNVHAMMMHWCDQVDLFPDVSPFLDPGFYQIPSEEQLLQCMEATYGATVAECKGKYANCAHYLIPIAELVKALAAPGRLEGLVSAKLFELFEKYRRDEMHENRPYGLFALAAHRFLTELER